MAPNADFHRILKTQSLGICAFDSDHHIVEANDEFLRILGLSKDQVPSVIIDPAEFCSDEPGLKESEITRADGGTCAVLVGGERQEDGGVCFAVDISRRKSAEEAYQRAAAEAQLASQAKSRFLANMSHEIRTPLGIMTGFAELAMTATEPSEIRNCLETIQRNGMLLSQIVGDVLDFSKIEASHLEVAVADTCVMAILRDAYNHLRLKAVEKDLAFFVETPDQIPVKMRTDAVRLKQILFNLIGNAIKFTSHGSVTLKVSVTEPLEKDRPYRMRFDVQDTGIGIPAHFHRELFQPFSRVESPLNRQVAGTGLGLALSRQLARALGGDVELIASEPDRGSTFSVSIDAGAFDGELMTFSPADPERTPKPEKDFPDLKGLRVLLVDDSPENQLLIHHYLKGADVRLDFAGNGSEAVRMVTEHSYDAILMDLQMPVMDGLEATRRIRRMGSRIPIFALTAHALQQEKERALQKGFDKYLTKPIERATILDALSAVAFAKRRPEEMSNNRVSAGPSLDHNRLS